MELDGRKLFEISIWGNDINHKFGKLGYLLGHRAMLASDIVNNKHENFKDPEGHRILMIDTYNLIENQIKELLLIQ
jgi:hypothetical protein